MNTARKTVARILVVDDEESLRTVVSQVLAGDGHEVTQASSGEEALQVFLKRPFPLVISDVKMGGMSGIDLLKKVKQVNEDTQVVIMTSNVSLDTAIAAMRAGAYDYLAKPFEELEVISNVVNRAIEKVRLTRENRRLLAKLRQQNAELEIANKSLKELSIRDGLTGLYNHRYFQETIATEILRSRRYNRTFTLLFMDIDFFKHYNDKHGHPQGDKLLVALSRTVLGSLRSYDFVARYGGEEFVILLPETPKSGGRELAEQIRQKIEMQPFEGGDAMPQGKVTVSIGLASYPDDGTDASAIIRHADDALYLAKGQGKNRVC